MTVIDYQGETITIFDPEREQEVTERITKWESWFVTSEGTFRNFADAKDSCARSGYPVVSIIPVPVAVGATIFEIILGRPL
jgi:hypothetical protein